MKSLVEANEAIKSKTQFLEKTIEELKLTKQEIAYEKNGPQSDKDYRLVNQKEENYKNNFKLKLKKDSGNFSFVNSYRNT